MWRKKKFIVIAALAAVVLAGTIGGAVYAQTANQNRPAAGKTLFARAAAILGIEQQKLESAFAQARREMRDEALDNQLKRMVEQGRITQQQADQYRVWWKSRPDVPMGPGFDRGPGFGGPHGKRGFGRRGPGFVPPGKPGPPPVISPTPGTTN